MATLVQQFATDEVCEIGQKVWIDQETGKATLKELAMHPIGYIVNRNLDTCTLDVVMQGPYIDLGLIKGDYYDFGTQMMNGYCKGIIDYDYAPLPGLSSLYQSPDTKHCSFCGAKLTLVRNCCENCGAPPGRGSNE